MKGNIYPQELASREPLRIFICLLFLGLVIDMWSAILTDSRNESFVFVNGVIQDDSVYFATAFSCQERIKG